MTSTRIKMYLVLYLLANLGSFWSNACGFGSLGYWGKYLLPLLVPGGEGGSGGGGGMRVSCRRLYTFPKYPCKVCWGWEIGAWGTEFIFEETVCSLEAIP